VLEFINCYAALVKLPRPVCKKIISSHIGYTKYKIGPMQLTEHCIGYI